MEEHAKKSAVVLKSAAEVDKVKEQQHVLRQEQQLQQQREKEAAVRAEASAAAESQLLVELRAAQEQVPDRHLNLLTLLYSFFITSISTVCKIHRHCFFPLTP